MPLTSKEDRYERELATMLFIRDCAEQGKANLSKKDFSSALSASEERVAYTLRFLEGAGFVTIETCYLPNGGRRENAYALTDLGHRVIAYCKR